MNPRVKNVTPTNNYELILEFENGEIKKFDVKPYLNKGIFKKLKDKEKFKKVRQFLGSICWEEGQDLCPDTLYEESIPYSPDPRHPRTG
jgi:hypothetical protein